VGRLTELTAARHGESVANAAFAAADRDGREDVEITGRDADVVLSPLGERQATKLGRWAAARPHPPDLIACSPYRRARQTADAVLEALAAVGAKPQLTMDERLRDRELGVLEMRTLAAIMRRFPEEHERRLRQGMFYWRPAGGESMADVALRVRLFLADLRREPGDRVLVITHDSVVLMLRYVLEALAEEDLADIPPVLNAAVTRWTRHEGRLRLDAYNDAGHLGPLSPRRPGPPGLDAQLSARRPPRPR
jgi:broad specificity phosphatase PhoE